MDAPRPLVSVVIPCYNQGGFLAEAIESAVSCQFPTQVIVVDDGSTDDSPAVASAFAAVTLVRQENRGLARARNAGLAVALGELVIFLDADDRLLPGAIDTGAQALIAHEDCAFAYGRCVMMGPDGAFWPTPEHAVVLTDHYAAMLRTNPIWMPAMAIFRRDVVVAAGGFRPGADAAADYDLYLRIARERPVHDHGRVVAAYRRHATSMSGDAGRMLREVLAVTRRHRASAREAGNLAAWRDGYRFWQDFYGTHLVEEIRAHLRARQHWDALRKAMLLAWLAPRIFARELRRKLRALYAGRAMPAAEISAPSRRADS